MDSSKWHRLSGIDETAKTGTCAVCGPVGLHGKSTKGQSRGRWQCRTQYRAEGLRRAAEGRRRRPHGLTNAERDNFLAGKTCAICGSDHNLVVDHDHKTGLIRGVLCRGCNVGIGQLGDSIAGLERALAYLRANGSS